MSEKDIYRQARLAYHNRSKEIKDFPMCVIVDQGNPVVVTQNVIITFYYEYVYHPKIGLIKITEDFENLTCKDIIDYYTGNNVDFESRKKSIINNKKSKRTAPIKPKTSKSTRNTPKKSKRTK
jgi:hypothetical protein